MTARHILSRWERVQSTLRQKHQFNINLWLATLHAADHAAFGADDLMRAMGCSASAASKYIHFMTTNDLVIACGTSRRATGRGTSLYSATPELHHFLGLKPASPTPHPCQEAAS